MDNLSTLQTRGLAKDRVPAVDVGVMRALGAHTAHARVSVWWGDTVARLNSVDPAVDAKALLAHRRVLEDPRAMQILSVIWLESELVDEAALFAAGLVKNFKDAPMTCHGIAVGSCEHSRDLGRMHKRVQNIVKAGQAFGLVQSIKLTTKKHEVRGTTLLHQIMSRVGQSLPASASAGLSPLASEAGA